MRNETPPAPTLEPDAIEVVVPNFNRRFSGVTTTVRTLLPVQKDMVGIAAVGDHLPQGVATMSKWRLFTLRRAPGKRPFRIFHARRNVEMVWGVVLRDLCRLPYRLVFTSAAQRHHKRFTRWLIARMDAVIATSPQAASYLRRPAKVIMHGIDTGRFAPSRDRAAAWAATGLPGKRGIGVFGRVRHQKGTDLFVEAMLRLLPDRPDVTAIVIGLTTPQEQAFTDALKSRIADAGLSERILILGEQPAESLPGWFRAISVYVAPMRWEGFGLTPLEAMASQTPVVATRCGAAPALVIDGQTGALVDVEDIDAITDAIARLIDDPALCEKMGIAGREHVENYFAVSREAREILDVYETLWKAG
ncbi:MAG: glycosyltransferase family 4 protein [Rhodobiaceae bacterium]|nr:glycosyltransferase family 4 protein [Rhodobiaceae bacterium]MCC0056335.1 glycosyltransferase family 4 protein [Rhodobiaceae bacterium]